MVLFFLLLQQRGCSLGEQQNCGRLLLQPQGRFQCTSSPGQESRSIATRRQSSTSSVVSALPRQGALREPSVSLHFVDHGKAEEEVSCSNHSRAESILKKLQFKQ